MRIAYATLLPREIDDAHRFLRPPLTAGYLAAYADKHRHGRDEHDIVDTLELDHFNGDSKRIARRMLKNDPQLVAFSVYVWNHYEVAEVCRRIRSVNTDVKIVLGGPEIAFTPGAALKIFEADWACTGEGELPFLDLLNTLERQPAFASSLPGMLHRRNLNGVCQPAPLANPLDDIPCPYSLGYLRIDADTVADLETTRGCPYRCRFCLYGKTLDSLRFFSLDRVRADISYAIEQGATSIYLMDPTFNYPRKRCRQICKILEELNDGSIEFSTEVRAEIIDENLADAFVRAGIKSVEIGLQSSSRETLRLMQRGLGTNHFIKGCRLLYERGIRAEIGMIVGLPGDDEDSIRHTAGFVLGRNLGELNVYRLQVLPGSEYHKMAGELGLKYDLRPPYFVHETPTLHEEKLSSILEQLEDAADSANRGYEKAIRKIATQVKRKEKARRKRELTRGERASSRLIEQTV